MNTEDDTIRILKRKPLSEIYTTISKRCNADMSEDKFRSIVETYGYTLEEFFEYEDGLYAKR